MGIGVEKKEELIKEYNELTTKINELNNERLKIVGKLELVEELEKDKK